MNTIRALERERKKFEEQEIGVYPAGERKWSSERGKKYNGGVTGRTINGFNGALCIQRPLWHGRDAGPIVFQPNCTRLPSSPAKTRRELVAETAQDPSQPCYSYSKLVIRAYASRHHFFPLIFPLISSSSRGLFISCVWVVFHSFYFYYFLSNIIGLLSFRSLIERLSFYFSSSILEL